MSAICVSHNLPHALIHAVAFMPHVMRIASLPFSANSACGLPPVRCCLFLPLFSSTSERRCVCWSREEAGLQPHEVAALPPAQQALHDILGSLSAYATGDKRREVRQPRFIPRVLAAFVDHFAWHGCAELNADLTLAEADEDALLEALADFLWEHRPA